MRVLFVCSEYPPALHGGIGTFVYTLAHHLLELGHQVWVVGIDTSVDAPKVGSEGGVMVTRLPHSPWSRVGVRIGRRRLSPSYVMERLYLSRQVARIARENNIEVVESYDWSGPLWAKPHKRLVVRLHGANSANAFYEGLPQSRLLRFVEKRNVAMADRVVSVSRHIGDVTMQALGLNRQFTVIYNGVDTKRFRPADAARDQFEVVYVGSITRRKGVFDLLNAIPLVLERVPEARFRLVGTLPVRGELRSALDSALANLPERARRAVVLAGRMRHEQLPAVYSRAAAAVFPSRAEAFGLTCVEAMACGAPVVMTSRASGPELVEDGVSGLLAEPADTEQLAGAIVRLLRDPKLRETLGRNARVRAVECFDVRKLAKRNAEFYEELIDGRV